MKRILTLLTAILMATGILVAVVATAAQATAITCQTRTHLSNIYPADGMYWNTFVSSWRWGNWQVSYCRQAIRWDPSGWRYERNGNVDVRVRFLNSAGHTTGVTSWVHAIGSQSTVTIAGAVPAGTWFCLDLRPVGTPYPPGITEFWPLGQVEF
jgi:hypothetical protein